MRKPVSARAAQAPGGTTLAIVPGGAMTRMTRNTPSLLGIVPGSTERSAV